MSVKGKLNFLLSQFRGFKTNRKIVVIESDDWGSQRIPSVAARKAMADFGINMESNPHSRVDTLENAEDLNALYDVFTQLKKQHPDKNPNLTCNFILTNPDYEKIRESKFEAYHYEDFITTYQNQNPNSDTWSAVRQGIENGFVKPQFHGREHINASSWLKLLREGNKDFTFAFGQNCFAIDTLGIGKHKNNLMAAFEFNSPVEKEFIASSIKDGLQMFRENFGFHSETAIPPRYVWNDDIEQILKANDVSLIQSAIIQQVPDTDNYKARTHYTGQKNEYGMYYTVRNAHFEPAYSQHTDWIGQVMSKAKLAFFMKTPLIISTHRLNYVGGISPENRTQNLKIFKNLISALIEKYPDVVFMDSTELYQEIKDNNHY